MWDILNRYFVTEGNGNIGGTPFKQRSFLVLDLTIPEARATALEYAAAIATDGFDDEASRIKSAIKGIGAIERERLAGRIAK